MIDTSTGRCRPVVSRRAVRAAAVELVAQMALIGTAWLLVVRLHSGPVVVERALIVFAFAVGVGATVLLAVAAWMSADRSARRIAAAVGLYTGIELHMQTVDAGKRGLAALLGSVAVLGVVGLLVVAVRRSTDPRRGRTVAFAVVGFVAASTVVITGTGALLPRYVPHAGVVAAADLVAWSGAGAAGLMLLGAGLVGRRPLPRRVGLAFATLSVAHAVRIVTSQAPGGGGGPVVGALVLAAVAMFLVAAVPSVLSAVRAATRKQEASRPRLAEAVRDHELHNVVAGLSGAQAQHAETAVGALLRDLALVHRAGGLAVQVEVDGEPCVPVDAGELTQVLTNLLVNCARHAPGARVWLRAMTHGSQVSIEVADDGPGLPPGSTAALLRRGVRGPGSTGEGMGLAIAAELVERHRGTFTVISGGRGCTAVLDLPVAARAASVEAIGA